jgi:phosphatidylglycerol---prolipoprotein diacylglyceryl transferase
VRPTLFQLGSGAHPFELHSYGFLIAIGVLVGVILAVRRGRSVGIETGTTLDLTFYAVIMGMLGSRLLYVLMHAPLYARLCAGTGVPRTGRQWLADCTAPLHIWQGGLVFLGGAVLAACTTLLWARRKKLGLGLVADVLAPSVSIGHVFGRLGCFMVGCCYGKPWPGGVHFPPGSVAYTEMLGQGHVLVGAGTTYGLHPTQLYEAAGELLIFLALQWLWRRRRTPGTVALAYAFGYGLLRFVVEIFRGDDLRGFLFQLPLPGLARLVGLPAHEPLFLSSAQFTALLLMTAATIAYALLRRRPRPHGITPQPTASSEAVRP